ncbi:hypothetical protein N9242_00955 [Vicingaceae bacterium]|nr:hypothetical protein [Vicingaceae bacterium]
MIFKDKINSESSLEINTDGTSIASGPYAVIATRDSGVYINGPLSISSPFTNIRMGGIYKFNSLLANTVPSNVITPIPVLEIDIPVKEAGFLIGIAAMVVSTAAG